MSISSIANSGIFNQWQAVQRSRSSAASSAVDSTATNNGSSNNGAAPAGPMSSPSAGGQTPSDSIKVALPNGFSFEVTHFGSNVDQATEDQMVKSAEQLAGALEGYAGVGSGANTLANGGASAADASDSQGIDGTQGAVSTDMIHLDLPNGVSIEVRHSQTGSETSAESQAVADRMVKATEELAAALQAYAGTSSAAAASNTTSMAQPLGANGRTA